MDDRPGELYPSGTFNFKVIGVKRISNGEVGLFDNDKNSSFEDYLLKFEVSRLQKLLAWLGREIFLGDFKAEKPGCDFKHYYLFWYQVHRKYVVSYFRGEDRRLDCPECNAEFLSGIQKNTPSDGNNKKERNLKLVKSDRGLKS